MRTTFRHFLLLAGASAVTGAPMAAQRPLSEATAAVREAIAELPANLARARSALAYAADGMSYGVTALRRLDYEFGVGLVILPDLPHTSDQVSDSLYRQARAALQRGAYRDAAELFMRVQRRDPRAALAADALYWHAWSMYRAGGTTGFESALASLDRLNRDHPRASVRGDARDLRIRVCGELAKLGDEKCASEVTTLARQGENPSPRAQAQGCPSEDNDERVAALNALLQMDAESAIPLLERTLARRDPCSATLRKKALFLVSQKRTSRAADILLNVVRTDPEPEIRSEAVFWLGQTRDERAVDLLADILQKETNEEVLDKAVFALSQHRSERASTMLRDLAQREDAPVKLREQAIFWIGQHRGAGNDELLMNLYNRVGNRELKDKIIFSLSQNRSSAGEKWLMDLALNTQEPMDLRKQALFWAGQSRSTTSASIGQLYDRINDQEMKEQVIFVLSKKKDSGAIDKLIDIAKNDRDRDMRGKAIFWLGQSRDPRVIKLLEEIISK
jgi:HEAT repeat protein